MKLYVWIKKGVNIQNFVYLKKSLQPWHMYTKTSKGLKLASFSFLQEIHLIWPYIMWQGQSCQKNKKVSNLATCIWNYVTTRRSCKIKLLDGVKYRKYICQNKLIIEVDEKKSLRNGRNFKKMLVVTFRKFSITSLFCFFLKKKWSIISKGRHTITEGEISSNWIFLENF